MRYCSRECQLKDWKCAVNPHKAMCKILKSREDTSGGASSVPKCSASPAAPSAADMARNKRWRKMIGIGWRLYEEGDYVKAMQTYQSCLSDFPDVEEADFMAGTFHGMTVVCWKQGDFAKSIVFHEKALSVQLKVQGAEHPDVAAAYGNMANVYSDQGDTVKSLELHEKSLAIQLKVLGAEHPDVARSYGNMARAYRDQGDTVKALELHEKSLIIWLKVLGAEHPDVATTYGNMAFVYLDQGDTVKALELHEMRVGPDPISCWESTL
jgi:tetratricopeptide (TPR) repeat protein